MASQFTDPVSAPLKIYRESFGVHSDNYPTALITEGLMLSRSKQGETILREAVKLRTDSLSQEHFWVAVGNSALGECLTTQKPFAEAEPLLVESYTTLNSRLGQRDPRTREALGVWLSSMICGQAGAGIAVLGLLSQDAGAQR